MQKYEYTTKDIIPYNDRQGNTTHYKVKSHYITNLLAQISHSKYILSE